LLKDAKFWASLERVGGDGYRERIASSSNDWFEVESRVEKQSSVKTKIIEGWREILSELDDLFEQVAEKQ
jgi:hypothetical protein